MHQCKNKSNSNVQHLEQLVGDFFPYSQEKLGFDRPLTIIFQSDEANAQTVLGKTAFYDPEGFEIVLYVDGRHPKDIMRSLSHELVHHAQNCRGDFKTPCQTDPGYAQRDPHLRKMEREAYTKGNLIFRDYEDLIKTGKKEVDVDFSESGEPDMSLKEWKNNEINQKLMKKWGLLSESKEEVTDAEALDEDTEGEETYHYGEDEGSDRKREGRLEAHLDAIEHHLHNLRGDMSYDEEHERRDEKDTDFKEGKDWGKSPEAFTGEEEEEEKDVARLKKSGVAEGWGYRDDDESCPEKDSPVEETAVDVARSRGQLHKTIPLDDEPEEKSDVPAPGVKVTDPEHLARTTAKLPVAMVREGSSRKISVREAKVITRRIMERFRKEPR
jgi:hypothetical protein